MKLLFKLIFIILMSSSKLVLALVVSGVPTQTCEVTYRQLGLFNLPKSTTVAEIKAKISAASGMAVEHQQLFFDGKVYDDSTTLENIPNLDEMSTVVLQTE